MVGEGGVEGGVLILPNSFSVTGVVRVVKKKDRKKENVAAAAVGGRHG